MRTENEIATEICDQIVHWIRNCGRDENDLAELVLEACDMIMTDEEAMTYQSIGELVKSIIIF